MFATVKWIIMVLAVAFFMRPAFKRTELKYVDGGFGLSFGIGSGLSFLLAWFVCEVTGLPFGTITMVSAFLILALSLNLYSFFRDKETFANIWSKEELIRFFLGFMAFVILFLFAVWAKSYRGGIDGQTEKYMDFGIMQSIYRQESAWPEDFWFAGEKLNYYFLGLSASVYLSRLSFVDPGYGYNFMLCTLFAVSLLMIFEIVSSLILVRKGSKVSAYAGGVAGAMCSVLAGNGHYLIFGVFIKLIKKIPKVSVDVKDYWFPDSTVYIGANPEVEDFGKHEFPGYTMILGDLHAHLVNMLWTLPFLAILIDYALRDMSKEKGYRHFINGHIIIMGLLLGLFRGSNFWDFPIYYVIAGGVILFTELSAHGVKILTFAMVLLKGAVIYAIAYLGTLPFTLQFNKMISGIYMAERHTLFYKMVILWAMPFVASVILVLWIMAEKKFSLKKLTRSDLTIIAITLCAIGLVLVPEVIYVKDIYGDDYARFNTMFKLTYQAYILFGMVFGLLLSKLINGKKWRGTAFLSILIIILSSYTFTSGKVWLYNNKDFERGISVLSTTLSDANPEKSAIKEACEILLNDDRKNIRIIEAVGGDYKDTNRLSSFTGVPTVEGWPVHEWLWQNSYDPVGARTEEVRDFYEGSDVETKIATLKKYDINYIFVGPTELENYTVNHELIAGLGESVFETPEGYRLIKVK
ncbi:MAG: hypothetical protein E7296_12520 [Lachnospiraceae bacterium]|nr:hypothetical protein [Lachnospiraceae bacterium]